MKLNSKGFAISSIMYLILVLCLIIVSITLVTMSNRRIVLDKIKNKVVISIEGEPLESLTTVFDEGTSGSYTFIAPQDGVYKIELWGAQGGDATNDSSICTGGNVNFCGGKGAYTSGIITLNKGETLYVYVGEKGKYLEQSENLGGFNGGGASGSHSNYNSAGGGGATDVRLVSGNWYDFDSLKSRIMVAAGGGGSVKTSKYNVYGGYGGALVGGSVGGTYNSDPSTGATQTEGGKYKSTANKAGSFGYAYQTNTSGNGWGGGGGGGFYGGGQGYGQGGSGGSSYISGYIGCNSISSSSTLSNITHTDSPAHYLNKIFSNPVMIAGNESMPNPTGNKNTIGHSGDGYARITFMSSTNSSQTEFFYDYTGGEQVFTAPRNGYYKLETWGAQGGEGLCNGLRCHDYNSSYDNAIGGYGGYSTGIVHLNKNDRLYVYVGGKGEDGVLTPTGCVNTACTGKDSQGGFNGGGLGTWDNSDNEVSGGGGGATHIAIVTGTLPNLSSAFEQNKILIISGGGGGGSWAKQGGSGGGIEGGPSGSGSIANQTKGTNVFGQGANAAGYGNGNGHGGGGGGLYGGYESAISQDDGDHGGGGSGYISNSLLLSSNSYIKHMTCYSCTTSTVPSTKTNSVNEYSNNPTSDKPKAGDGYAKITYIGTTLD